MYFFKLTKDEWFLDKNKVLFNENHPTMRKIRGIFFASIFVITIPLFLRKNLS